MYDVTTGLRYMNARYYDPASGRFLSEDPLGFAAGDTNLYRYVGNHVPEEGAFKLSTRRNQLLGDRGA